MKTKELKNDDLNFNKHTKKGMEMLKDAIKTHGTGRSILIDKNNVVIAGNGVKEACEDIVENVRVIESDGTKLIAVKRMDIDIDSIEGREMALGDNAIGEANLQWDEEKIQQAKKKFGINPTEWDAPDVEWGGGFDGLPDELQGQDLGGGTFVLIQGDGQTEYNRIKITYNKEDEAEITKLVGLQWIEKVIYKVQELGL